MRKLKIKGFNQEFLLVNTDGGDQEGSIATREQFDNFKTSFAHLFPDGSIMRYGQKIGTRDDIEWVGDTEEVVVKGERL